MRARRKPRTAAELRRAATSRPVHTNQQCSACTARSPTAGMSLVAPATTRDTTNNAGAPPHPRRGGQNGMTRQIVSVAAPPSYIICTLREYPAGRHPELDTSPTPIDTHPYPKTGVLLQGRKTPTLGTANPHSIYPVHTSIRSPSGIFARAVSASAFSDPAWGRCVASTATLAG